MGQIFHPSFNTFSRLSIVFGGVLAGAALLGILQIGRSPYVTRAQETREQPVPFSHKHHVSGLGIDCRYCHTSVETSAFAGIPPTKTCMTCHSQIWADSPMLEPVRESYRTDESIEWLRLHDLADFVYFNHSIHVKKGDRVRHLPWTRQRHAVDVEGKDPTNGVVPRVPSRAGAVRAASRRSVQLRVGTTDRPAHFGP